MTRTRSSDPSDRMGVYKQLSDVPASHRLERYASEYDGRDVYETFLTDHLFLKFESERFKQNARLAGRRWKAHIRERGRHHALATPTAVETWVRKLLECVKLNTAYSTYWTKLERFYTWLQSHPDHPHVYHPVLMAAANRDTANRLWYEKIARRRRRSG